jgi:uncharacterized membrane protein
MVPLTRAEGFDATLAMGISGDGRRIVGSATSAEGEVAVIWDQAGRMIFLSDMLSPEARTATHHWKLERARAISKDGRTIVGYGTNPAGIRQAWLITLPG